VENIKDLNQIEISKTKGNIRLDMELKIALIQRRNKAKKI